jgi:electron transfer flavoprotein alpha subunit
VSDVFVWIETFRGTAVPTSWEAIAAGKAIGDRVVAVILGTNAQAIAQEAASFGATKAIICDDATLADFRLEPYAALLTALVREHQPQAVLAVASGQGRELLAATAADTESPMIGEALSLAPQDGGLTAVRAAYAGKVLSDVRVSASGTIFVTLRSRAFKALEAVSGASIEVVTVQPVLSEDQIATKIDQFTADVGTVNLSDAAIIVSGGRAMANNPKEAPAGTPDPAVWKAQDGFANTLQPLADALGAALGASRAAVDAGYIPYAHQVGQTGRVVSPDLYIACGISGAIQHQAGMRTSKVIVAINKDPEAPIFKMARFGLVGDLYAIVPALTEEVKKRLGK